MSAAVALMRKSGSVSHGWRASARYRRRASAVKRREFQQLRAATDDPTTAARERPVLGESASRPVSRVLDGRRACARQRGGHSSGASIAERLKQPTRTTARRGLRRSPAARRPYSVLLLAGLAVPLPSPVARCALTAPFHPYPRERRRSVLCGAIPGVAPAGRYPAPILRGARTFLGPEGSRPPGRLAGGTWRARGHGSRGCEPLTAPAPAGSASIMSRRCDCR